MTPSSLLDGGDDDDDTVPLPPLRRDGTATAEDASRAVELRGLRADNDRLAGDAREAEARERKLRAENVRLRSQLKALSGSLALLEEHRVYALVAPPAPPVRVGLGGAGSSAEPFTVDDDDDDDDGALSDERVRRFEAYARFRKNQVDVERLESTAAPAVKREPKSEPA